EARGLDNDLVGAGLDEIEDIVTRLVGSPDSGDTGVDVRQRNVRPGNDSAAGVCDHTLDPAAVILSRQNQSQQSEQKQRATKHSNLQTLRIEQIAHKTIQDITGIVT